jgi:hypothetical protein
MTGVGVRAVWLAPVAGLVWSACLLIYGRVLGRVGWVLTQTKAKKRKKKRRRKLDDVSAEHTQVADSGS